MRNFKTKWLSSLLSVLLVFSMFVGGIQVSAYAEQSEEAQQAMNQVDPKAEQADEKTEESVDDTKSKFTEENGIAAVSVSQEDAEESAVITKPSNLALDGSKSYVIFTSCFWGGHTYGIGSDAAATEGLGITRNDCKAGETLYLAQKGLGWTLTQTKEGLIIQSGGGHYLTVSDDQTKLVISQTKKISGLTINNNGTLALADAVTEMVYLQNSDSEPEPKQGDNFNISKEGEASSFYFAEIKEKDDPEKPDKPDEPKPSEEVLFPSLLPQTNFRAEVVSPDKVYGDDQYVIFTKKGDKYVAITSGANCSSPLSLDKAAAAGVRLTSPDQNVLWTVNNNRSEVAPESGYYKYIRSCASNQYLAAKDGLLDENINDDFYLADKDGSSALLATSNGRYVTLQGDKYSVTSDKNSASRFYFAKLLQKEQQSSGGKTAIPEGTLLRLVDWNSIEDGKTYAIINATEFNHMHYAISGNGRLARYGADNLTNYNLCPNENVNGVYGNAPCESSVGDIFYTNGQDILWTASGSNNKKAVFKNNSTGLYLKLSNEPAAEQTPSISTDSAEISIEPVEGKSYAYLGNDSGKYLGIWQYIAASVSENAPERCAYYLAEVLDENDIKNLPATELDKDSDKDTVSFGGLYSIYQGSQHLLNDGTGVENFILMDDGKGNFKPSNSKFGAKEDNNYYVTYCADYKANMPVFTEPGKYKAVSLDEYDGFKPEQKSALQAIISNSYPYVTEEAFLSNLKNAGFEVSENCGTDEIMAGIQAAIYSVTNPREDGEWGYESSDGWAHNSYEVNKPKSYVSDPAKAESDVNTVRDYLLSLNSTAMTAAEGENGGTAETGSTTSGGMTTVEGDYFAITTEIDGKLYALANSLSYSRYDGKPHYFGDLFVTPYDPEDISQMWYADEKGYIHWFPATIIDKDGKKSWLSFRDEPYRTSPSGHLCLSTVYGEDEDCYWKIPMRLNENNDLEIVDPDNIRSQLDDKIPNKPKWRIEQFAGKLYLEWDEYASTEKVLSFSKKSATPIYPESIDYDLKSCKWKIDYSEDGKAYGVTINGELNAPIREKYDNVNVNLYCNGELIGPVKMESDSQTFSISTNKTIPDEKEAHFWIRIEEKCVDVTVFEPMPGSGWQLQIGGVYSTLVKEIHEDTASVPVEKIWADEKDHSGDKVDLCLLENGVETEYTVTLDASDNWKGAFKHVPNRRWTYAIYYTNGGGEGEIPILTHKYTVNEKNVKPGYTPSYNSQEPLKIDKLTPAASHYVQAVLSTEDGKILAVDLANGRPFAEYAQGKESQKFFINGNRVLIAKLEDSGEILYQCIYLEQTGVKGKYRLYFEDYDGTKVYCPGIDDNQPAVVELRDAATGEALTQLPTDSFKPVQTALELYQEGKPTGKVLDYMSNEPVTYNSKSLSQKFRVYNYEEQFLFYMYPGEISSLCMLEPCEDAEGQYMLYYESEEKRIYMGIDSNEKMLPTENKEDAARFGLKDAIQENDIQTLTVTNTPKPEDVVIPTPSTTSVTAKKVWKLDDGGKAADSVKVALLKNGTEEKTVTLSEENNWTYTWTGLEAGNTWTVKELDVPEGFDSTVQQSGTSFTITNDDKANDPTKPDDPNKPDDPEKPDKPTKPEKPTKPTKPSKPTNPNKPSKPNHSMVPDDALIPGGSGGSGGSGGASGSGSPKTGDNTNAVPWLVVMGLSAGGLTALLLSKRRKAEENEK